MLSIRALSRSIPKAIFRSSSALRPLSTLSRPSFLQSTWKPATRTTYSAFSTSIPRREPAGDSDLELSAKIEQELLLEKEAKDPAERPPSVEAYLNDSPFEITDVTGSQEVTLTKKFGDETIKVTFTIADLNNFDEEADHSDEDHALEDEADDFGDEIQSQKTRGGINQRGGKINAAPEDSLAPSDRAEFDGEDAGVSEQEPTPGFAINLMVTISKPGKGAIQAEVIAEDGVIDVQEISYFPKSDLADAKTAEKQFSRDVIYPGPPFTNLDPDLQEMFVKYLDERGINSELAVFVPDYIDYKEQREYLQWLSSMKSFVDA